MKVLSRFIWILGIIVSICFLSGCPTPVQPPPQSPPPPQPVTIVDSKDIVLEEHHWMIHGADGINLPQPGQVTITFNLKQWTRDYYLEVMLLDLANYLDFSKGRNFSAVWHKAVINLGPLTEMFGVSGGIYFLVVDNSDNGWFKTDFDFVTDIAVYDIKLVYTPNQ